MNMFETTLEYQKLKQDADNAYNMYSQTQSAMDWEWFKQCESRVAEFAYINEDNIDWTSV